MVQTKMGNRETEVFRYETKEVERLFPSVIIVTIRIKNQELIKRDDV